jgi:hypothetical protein
VTLALPSRTPDLQLFQPQRDTLDIFQTALEFGRQFANTELVPKSARDKPAQVAGIVLYGREIGLSPMVALSVITFINGVPVLVGKGALAMVRAAGHRIWESEESKRNGTRATWYGQRRGEDYIFEQSFSMEDARRAHLLGRQGPWTEYPRIMCGWRAIGYLGRLAFSDVLLGLSIFEDVQGGFVPEDESPPALEAQFKEVEPEPQGRKIRRGRGPSQPPPQDPPPTDEGPDEPPPPEPSPPLPQPGPNAGPGASGGAGPVRQRGQVNTRPTQPEQADPGPAPPDDDAPASDTELAGLVAAACRQSGVDRAAVINAVTDGRKVSAKNLTHEEGAEVINTARAIARGELRLDYTDDHWVVAQGGGTLPGLDR